MVETGSTKFVACSEDYTLWNSCEQESSLNEANNGFIGLYEEALNHDLGSIDEDWFNSCFEHCNSECSRFVLEYETSKDKPLATSQQHSSNEHNVSSNCEMHYPAGRGLQTGNCRDSVQDSFIKQGNENLESNHIGEDPTANLFIEQNNENLESNNNGEVFTNADASELEFYNLLQENIPREIEHNQDQTAMSDENDCTSIEENDKKCNDSSVVCLNVQDFICNDSAEEQSTSHILEKFSPNCCTVLESPVNLIKTPTFKNVTPLTGNIYGVRKTSCLSSQLLKWSPITQTDTDQSSPRIFPLFQSPLSMTIRSSTPCNITQSLGVQICGKDLEWNSAMETPLAAEIGPKCKKGDTRKKIVHVAAQVKAIPRTLFIEDELHAEEEIATSVDSPANSLMLNCEQQFDQTNNNIKEQSKGSSSLHCVVDNLMPATSLISEPKIKSNAIDQNIVSTLKDLVSSQGTFNCVETLPNSFNVGEYSCINEEKNQEATFRNYADSFSVADKCHTTAFDCLEQSHLSATSVQNALSFLFAKESNMTLRCKENEENSVSFQHVELDENIVSTSNHSETADISLQLVEVSKSATHKSEPLHLESVMFPLNSLESNKMCKFSGFHYASGKSININQQSLKEIEFMWRKVKDDPWTCIKDNTMQLLQNCDTVENKVLKPVTSTTGLKQVDSNVINNSIVSSPNQCHESSIESQLVEIAPDSDILLGEEKDIRICTDNKNMTMQAEISSEINSFEKSSILNSQFHLGSFSKPKRSLDNDVLSKEYGNESQSYLIDIPLTQMLEVAESTYVCLKEMEEGSSQLQISPRINTKINNSINTNFNCNKNSPNNSFQKSEVIRPRKTIVSTNTCIATGVSSNNEYPQSELLSGLEDSDSENDISNVVQAMHFSSPKCQEDKMKKPKNISNGKKHEASISSMKHSKCVENHNGFTTASGKLIKVSSSSLLKSRQVFADLDAKTAKEKSSADNTVLNDCLYNIKNCPVVSDKNCFNNEGKVDIKCNVKNDTKPDISDNGGDKVTSCDTNSEVNELSYNVNKSDALLKELSEECVLQRNKGLIKCLTDELNEKDSTLYKNDGHFQANSLQKPELAYTNYILSGTSNLEIAPIFYTASGKKVAVSEHSLKKAKVLLGKENSRLEEETNNTSLTNSKTSLDNDKLEEVTEYVPSFDMGNFIACSQENNTLLDPSDEKFFVNCCEYNDTDFVHKCSVNDLALVQESDERNTSKLKNETKRLEDSELAINDCVNQCESGVVSFQTIHNSDKTDMLSTVLEKNGTSQRQGLGDNKYVECKILTDNHEENWHATHTTESFTTNHTNSYINKITYHMKTETEVNNLLSLKDDGNLTKDKANGVIHINIENHTESINPQINQSNHYTRQSDRLPKNTNRKFTEEVYNEESDIKNIFCEQIPFSEFFTNPENMNTPFKQAAVDSVNDPASKIVDSVISEFHNLDQHCNSTTERPSCDSINYVGFATASGKKVEISGKCLLKAKQLFSSIDKNYKTENVAYPEQSTKDITDKSHKTVQKNDSQSLHTKFIGFTTASGKKVDVLAESLSKAKMALGGINENFCTTDEKRKFESHTKNQSDMLNSNNKSLSTRDYLDQSMESQMPHSVSKEMICTETVENLKNLQKTSKDTVIIQQPKIKNSGETESSMLIVDNISEMIQSVKNSNGSSNKVLNIRDINQLSESEVSEHSALINPSKKLINKELCENDKYKKLKENMTNITEVNYFSFNTASGNKITVSKRALEVAKKVLDDNDSKKKCLDFNKDCVDGENTQTEYEIKFPKYSIKEESISCGGFYTATGKQVTVSNDSLEVDKTLLKNTSINNLEKSKNLGDTKGNDGFSVGDQTQNQKPVGFTTASGKELHISEQSLKHVKQLLQNCEKEFAACKSNVSSDDISSCIAVNSEISVESSLCNKFNNTVPNEFPINQLDMKNLCINSRANTSLTSAEVTKDSNTSCSSELIFPLNKQHYRNKTSSKRTNKEMTIIESHHQKRCRTDEYGQESISVTNNKMPSYCVSQVEEIRHSARKSQEERIKNKSVTKVPVLPGLLWRKKSNNTRRGLREIVGGMLPGSAKNKFSAEEMQIILSATLSSLKQFVFKPSNYFDAEIFNNSSEIKIADSMIIIINDKNEIGFDELSRAFLDGPGVDPNLVNNRWIENHYSWIVWKLAAMEVSFPSVFGKQCLTPENVLLQLKYRYDREIDNAQRSALKKIMERDDTPMKTMVLCVAGINSIQSAKKEALDKSTDCEECLLLTDGWYSIPASVDNAMKRLIKNGKIALGQKIIVSDAELIGSDIPCSPLEAPPELMLKVSTNSMRRARWNIKLGFFQSPKPFPVSFSSVFSDGGLVGCVDCVVQRVYPLLYMEKYPTGNIAFHNERVESKAADNYLKLREHQLEKLAESVQKEFEALIQEKENKKERKKRQSHDLNQLGFQELNTGEEIYEAVDTLAEFGSIEMDLNTQQKCLLFDYKSKLQSEQREQLEKMMNKSINEAMEENKLVHERISVPLLKVLLMGISEADKEKHGTCLLTVWRPSEKALQYLREGCCIRIYHLTPGTARKWKNQISLNATKRTDYEDKPVDHHIIESCFIPRKVSQFVEINGESAFGEVDVVGVVVSVVSSLPELCAQLQIVYISDYEMKFLAVKFPKGISHLGMEEILQPGKIVAASNLSVERHYNCHIPTVVASELSYFTCCPKSPLLQSTLKEIQISVKNIPDFLTEAQNMLKRLQCQQLYSPLTAQSFQPNLVSPMIRTDREIFSAQGVKKQFGSSKKKLYPVYSPLCLQTKSPLCPTIEQIPHTPKHTPSPYRVLDTVTISPAETRSHEIKDKIIKLSKYGSAPSLPILTSPASASTKKPFSTPYVKQETTPLTTKRRGIRQWRGRTLPDSNEKILGKQESVIYKE